MRTKRMQNVQFIFCTCKFILFRLFSTDTQEFGKLCLRSNFHAPFELRNSAKIGQTSAKIALGCEVF